MARRERIAWHSYQEDDYVFDTGVSPYVEIGGTVIVTLEFVKYVSSDLGYSDEEIQSWYAANILPMLESKRAPEIQDMITRVINVYFVKEYKYFFNKNNKKTPSDYILNIDKIIDEKMNGTPPMIFNSVQTFMLNYEIKKLLDKAITIANEKYDNIVCINGKMSTNGVLNIISYLKTVHCNYQFNYVLLDKEDEFAELASIHDEVQITSTLF